ncbi:hypothetical protein D0Z07_6890 [Hyphodiscus hymeniophilus]|uniref:Tetratricopeptide repeat protein n=1 Tax=Hyphodiscus hymeniophilus TaxID=353542 RepID=A0A9P6VGB5_9HELO|nr:hypothetical protein D0Z07_6890 [Hyphodiscus hymeniophilus]
MSTLRKMKPAIELTCKSLRIRSFQTSPSFAAKPARSPRVQKSKTASRLGPTTGTARGSRSVDGEAVLPTLALLESGHKSGALGITPDSALEILRQYQERERRPTPGWERKLCDDHGISAAHLYLLGMICMRSPSDPTRHLGQRLLRAAAALGDKHATFHLIKSALVSSALSSAELATPLQRLAILAKQQDPDAMLLYGQVLEQRGKEDEALKWFREAAESGPDFVGLGEAIIAQSRILLRRNDEVGAETMLRKAALELDEPRAYFMLGKLQARGSVEQELYLMKAASSGIPEAAGELGVLEVHKVIARSRALVNQPQPNGAMPPDKLQDFAIAREWLEIGAASGDRHSMLNLATFLKSVGRAE